MPAKHQPVFEAKPIMKKQTQPKGPKVELENGAKIAPHVKISSLKQDRGGTTWRSRFTIKGKRTVFSANPYDEKDEAYVTINRKIQKAINGEKLKSKRSDAPVMTEVAKAYLEASVSSIPASQGTRKNNLCALRTVTRGLVPGSDPVFKKEKNGTYTLVDGGFWNNLRLDKLDKKVGRGFLDRRIAGYAEKTPEWHERACGANDCLRQSRGVFTQAAINEVYEELFKMPDLEDKKTGFLKARFLPARRKKWKAPSRSVIEQIFEKVPALETEDPDVYGCFLLEYGCGLSWGEAMQAQYAWLDEADRPNDDGSTRYVIKVQPTAGWVPKCVDRERSATVPERVFQKLLDLRFVPRAPREDRKSAVNISDDDLAKRVWSEPASWVAKSFGVSATTIANQCRKRGIPTPPAGFWTKVDRGLVDNPNGEMPREERTRFLLRAQTPEPPKDDFILQRHRCYGETGANRRLARWFRKNIIGWDRKQVGHELRKLNISLVICETGSLIEGSKHAGHSSTKVTEEVYFDVLKNKRVDIPVPGA